MDDIVNVIGAFSRKGIRLWSENGQLRYKAPKGSLTREEIDELRPHRNQILSLLESAAGAENAEPKPDPQSRVNLAPLTYTQLARWNAYQLGRRLSSSFIPSALRLLGPL